MRIIFHKPLLVIKRWLLLAWLNTFQIFLSERVARSTLFRLATGNSSAPASRNQLLVDVSVIVKSDARTGIQRVVRALLLQLLKNPPLGYDVIPVHESRWHGYQYAWVFHAQLAGYVDTHKPRHKLRIKSGDVFLGLDLSTHSLIRSYRQLNRWKMAGVKFYFVVHDLLPALHPEWFSEKSVKAYLGWIRNVAIYADGASCVSKAVCDDLQNWLDARLGVQRQTVSLGWFHLGGDIQSSVPSEGKSAGFDELIARLSARPSILMTGTIEPRKGHAQTLAAFEALWKKGRDVNLVIVGKAGWRVDTLIQRLRNHPEFGSRLIWLEDATDEMLCLVYSTVAGLLMASEGEGFGLPIVEAAQYEKPILARNLPVFQEIAGEHACYFSGTTPEVMSAEIGTWLDLIEEGNAVTSSGIKMLTWEDSARKLLDNLNLALNNGQSRDLPIEEGVPCPR